MTLRKLTPPEIAALCACLLLPAEWGHYPDCAHYQAKRQAYAERKARRRKEGKR